MIETELFNFAYVPVWYEQLYELSQMAMPEPWKYKEPGYETQNTDTPILERYSITLTTVEKYQMSLTFSWTAMESR